MTPLPPEVAVRVEGLSKRYRIGRGPQREDALLPAVARALVSPFRNYRDLRRLGRFGDESQEDVIWALRDVAFELRAGEVLGIVGRNGAGKSTLLKLLSRVTEPTLGTAWIRGRVASLIEVGTGFHPDLTGRENVYLNGTMHGMSRREVAAKFDEIVEFAEIAKFIDTPVKRYSSGMYVRLAFAVAAHIDPDVLLTDEVLAVGDIEFQRKCIGRMRDVAGSGRTVIFVSHNKAAVASLCTRALWLDDGQVRADGAVDDVLDGYLASVGGGADVELGSVSRQGDGRVRVQRVSFRNAQGAPARPARAGETLDIALAYEARRDVPLRSVTAWIFIDSALGQRVLSLSTDFAEDELGPLPPRGEIVCRIEELPLNDGAYVCSIKLRVGGGVADRVLDAASFEVDASAYYPGHRHPGSDSGHLLVRHRWLSVEREASAVEAG
jgi:lipopolysaccharide transport system ATP-binding protein